MFAALAGFIDWSAIQFQTLMMPSTFTQNLKVQEALEFLKTPDFSPVESSPARVEFNPDGSGLHFRFPTPRPSGFVENDTAYGRLYRCTEHWKERPVVILLHGSDDMPSQQIGFPWIARRFNRAGFNAATLVAPYHFQRQPRQYKASYSRALGSPDCLRVAQASAQAVSEIRALTGWLLGEGCPAVAVWGFSMGGWYAGKTICADTRLAAAVMASPVVRSHPYMEQHALRPAIRARWQEAHDACELLNSTALELTSSQPVIRKENVLLIGGMYDMFVPKEDVEDLWQTWGRPEIWRVPYGHVGVCFCSNGASGLAGRMIHWLGQRLDRPSSR